MVYKEEEQFGLGELPEDAITELHPTWQSTSFTAVLTEMNNLVKRGIIEDYAIGGGYASIYHGVPYFTEDVDILVVVSGDEDFQKLYNPEDLYKYFEQEGYMISKDYVYIDKLAVQFFPNISLLFNEAVKEALWIEVDGVLGKVVSLEYLITLLLTSFRPKDRIKITELVVHANMPIINQILERFDDEEQQLSKRLERILGQS